MTLSKIPVGAILVVDANIIVYAIEELSAQCQDLLVRCSQGELTCILPYHTLAEVMHQLMISEARGNGWIKGSNPARQLAEHPEHVRSLMLYKEIVRDIFATGFVMEALQREDFGAAMEVQHKTGLLTNDALLVAIAQRVRANAIITADHDFSRVRGITIYTPDDISA